MVPSGPLASVRTLALRSSIGSRSLGGFSHQSTSPFSSAAAAVAGSGMTIHSTRSKLTIFGPASQSGVPFGRGT